MKVAIISDIHDNIPNLKKCLSWCNKNEIRTMICCGDLTNKETLKFLSEKYEGKIYLVRGNMELYEDRDVLQFKNIEFLKRFGKIRIDDFEIGVCHEIFFFEKFFEKGRCDIVFYGHTHRPGIGKKTDPESAESIQIINPGTLGGVFQRSTFAVWDSESGDLELKVVDELDS